MIQRSFKLRQVAGRFAGRKEKKYNSNYYKQTKQDLQSAYI